MGNQVVRVIAAESNLSEGAFRFTFEYLACENSKAAIGHSRSPPEHFIEIVLCESALLTGFLILDFNALADLETLRIDVCNVVFGNVVSGGKEDFRRDNF